MKMPFTNDKPIRLIELFGGIGSQAMALSKLGVNFEHYRLIEFDKYPVTSYNAIHGTNFTPTDITKIHGEDLEIVDTDKYCYLMTYSFPCQDLSVAGKQQGMSKGSGTRSGLLWEVERLLNETEYLPQLLLMENVPQVHGNKNREDFENWIQFLKNKGYSNYWQDLNAKDYGVAQNRNRCFMVSILGNHCFYFPKPRPLTKRMVDYLEDSVDEKYYIDNEKSSLLLAKLIDNEIITAERERERLLTFQSITPKKGQSLIAFPQGRIEESAIVKQKAQELSRLCVDLTVNQPKAIKVANCLVAHLAKDGNAISNRKSDGNGVIEWKLNR